jgi:hypothetical protein
MSARDMKGAGMDGRLEDHLCHGYFLGGRDQLENAHSRCMTPHMARQCWDRRAVVGVPERGQSTRWRFATRGRVCLLSLFSCAQCSLGIHGQFLPLATLLLHILDSSATARIFSSAVFILSISSFVYGGRSGGAMVDAVLRLVACES